MPKASFCCYILTKTVNSAEIVTIMIRWSSIGALFLFTGLTLADRCFDCICELESHCSAIGCRMDEGSLSCGYLQIKWPYYQDCYEPWGSTKQDWKNCANDYNCSKQCMEAYIARYSSMCTNKSGCELIARIHNGGPNGCHRTKTDWYWNKIRQCLHGEEL